jgi:deoxyribose-phosphate aldolase
METVAKVAETRRAIELGALEIDMVLPIGHLKDGDYEAVFQDIEAVVSAAQSKKIPVKVILETSYLSREEKIAACILSKRAGAAFVKTSTGFGGSGATVEDIRLMRAIVGTEIGVKASGGIRTREDALKMLAAGANRIGASASVTIVTTPPGTVSGAAGGDGY